MSGIKIKDIIYGEFGRAVEISNGKVDLVVTVDLGPRIIRYGFIGENNMFCESNGLSKPLENGEWRIRGGHRLWHSPEREPRSYMPDNEPVEWQVIENGIRVSQKVEPWVQIKKEMEITLSPCSSRVKVLHKLTNKNAWPIELAAWSLSVMAPGGKQIIPQPGRDSGLLPNRVLALWPYSKMNDHRVTWGDRYVVFRQDPETKAPFKMGISNEDGWAAYFNHGNLFIKSYNHEMNGRYPDFGVSYETYTTDFMMEMETLSPLTYLEPDHTLAHIEEWLLIGNVDTPSDNDEDIGRMVKKYICC